MEKGSVGVDYERKRREYAQQTGDIRKGIGMAAFWYNTGVWPISLETSSCRMVMNQDGSIQMQVGRRRLDRAQILHLRRWRQRHWGFRLIWFM